MKSLIEALSNPKSYPHFVEEVAVYQTHISVVFVAGAYAYKLKKPVSLGFVDYSTLEKRRYFCEREIALNQRLAPDVYLDVVAVIEGEVSTMEFSTIEALSGTEVVEWAVRMRRLDESNTLRQRLYDDRVPPGLFDRLGKRLAQFHEGARGGAEIDECAVFEVVEKNALDNFSQAKSQVGKTVNQVVFERLRERTHHHLEKHKQLISKRARQGVARDTHGDLRLEHVYIDDDDGICIVDCIEFNDTFRYADPICDIAFLIMDLGFRGFDEEVSQLVRAYFEKRDDEEGRELIDFYVAYRSCVRAKVHGLKATEPEVPDEQRQRAAEKARAHWLYALWRLEPEGQGPSLTLIGGLPAVGKSTLARKMRDRDQVEIVLDSDRVRKELAGFDPDDSAEADFGQGIYTSEFTERTYMELSRRVKAHLARGQRVAVAATFTSDKRRRQLLKTARCMGVPVRFIECVIPEKLARQRLAARSDDPSDADLEIYEALKKRWEPLSPPVQRVHEVCDTSGGDQ